MSYVLHIIRKPIPYNDEQAWEHLWKIAGEEKHPLPGQHVGAPDFIQFIEKLLVVYPCICYEDTNEDEEDDYREYIWSDGPLIGNAGVNITVLGMVCEHDEAIEFIVATAKEFNFIVFNSQTGKIYR
jgi:hypothetical protein